MTDSPYITEIRRLLIDFPEITNYRFMDNERKLLRKCLFEAISCNGKYLDMLFPNLFMKNNNLDKVYDILNDEINWLFADYDKVCLKQYREISNISQTNHEKIPCARIFRKGEPIYKCLTCGFDETCALCSQCYQREEHRHHEVHVSICQRENGGVCDCGDPEAWVGQFRCKCSAESAKFNVIEPPRIPSELQDTFKRLVCILLDYIIDVMSHSYLQLFPNKDTVLEHQIETDNRTLDPRKYGYAVHDVKGQPSETYSLLVYNDQNRHLRNVVERIHLASKKVTEFAVMIAEQVQKNGRATVIRSRDLLLLTERQKILSSTGLATCIRNSRDEVRESMCHEIILWMNSLLERDLFKSSESLKNILCECFCSKWQPGVRFQLKFSDKYSKGKLCAFLEIPNVDCTGKSNHSKSHWSFVPSLWDFDRQLCQNCEYNEDLALYESSSFRGSRFQYLVYLDIRFWKSARSTLHDFYLTSLITNLKFKKLFAFQYVDIYPVVADLFLSIDSDPELNIMCKLSSQLFTCPSHSTAIILHGDVTRILATIYNFLKNGEIQEMSLDSESNFTLSKESLKNRRWGQIFFDISYILNKGKDRELILTNDIIPIVCDILSIFQGKPVLKREKDHHVEYESTEYTSFFHAIQVVYQFAEYVSRSITNLEAEQRRLTSGTAIDYVASFLLKLEFCEYHPITGGINDVDYGSTFYNNFDSIEESEDKQVSFLHPLHSFLSWLIEFSAFAFSDLLKSILDSRSSKFLSTSSEFKDVENCLITIFKYPIQSAVLSSQIKSGFWVRNGFSVRSQLQLYKNTSLREQGYLRDLFLVQNFVICLNPDTVMSIFLKEWLFFEWSDSPESHHKFYEPSVLPYMIEECLGFFMHILTEDTFLKRLLSEATTYLQIKSEIIHHLCFGPLSYSKLCSRIPEHIYSEKRFDATLNELSDFKASRNSTETGTYHLKEEFFDEINPYYFNYTINKRDDAISLMKERISRIHNISASESVIQPKRTYALGSFKRIATFTTSPLFVEFLIKVAHYIGKHPGQFDGLLEAFLHLIHICAMPDIVETSSVHSFETKAFEISSVHKTSLVESLYDMLILDYFKRHHMKIRAIFTSFCEKQENMVQKMQTHFPHLDASQFEIVVNSSSGDSERELKKRIAKGKQAKLIAKFKKQQSLFIKFHQMLDDCSDVEMDAEDEDGWKFPEPHCILCQDTAESSGPFGIIAYVSRIADFRQIPFDDRYWFLRSFSDEVRVCDGETSIKNHEHHSEKWNIYMKKIKDAHVVGPGFNDPEAVHRQVVSQTCGHGMHFRCYMEYLSNNKSRLNQITRNNPDCAEHQEFLCPLCKAISNTFIPILWSSNNRSLARLLQPLLDESDPFAGLPRYGQNDEAWLRDFHQSISSDLGGFSILTSLAVEMIGLRSENVSDNIQTEFRTMLQNMSVIMSLLTFPQLYEPDCPQILINSIKANEISLRERSDTNMILQQISNNNLVNLRALNELRITSLLLKFSHHFLPETAASYAHIKCLAHFQILSPELFNSTIIHSDFFEILVTSIPVPSMNMGFNAILHACFLGKVIQNIHIFTAQLSKHNFYFNEDYSIFDVPASDLISDADANAILKIFKSLIAVAPHGDEKRLDMYDLKFGRVFFSMLLKSVTPFLRQSSIYAHVCCANQDCSERRPKGSPEFEADNLCSFLKIPTLREVLNRIIESSTWEAKRFYSFLHYLGTNHQTSSSKNAHAPKTMEYPGFIRLVDLPERLDEFFTEYYYLNRYQNPNLSIENPAVCLFCAAVVDEQKRALGSPHGQCSTHFMKECTSSVGAFLVPKDRCILLLHKNGGTFYKAPYLDYHGEVAADDKKGRILYFLRQSYDEFIQNSWLQHSIPNLIIRKLDSVIDAGGWDTL